MKNLFLTVLLLAWSFLSFSQTVENVDYNLVGNSINTFYDISGHFPAEEYEIKVEFVDADGQVIIPRTLKGDIGRTKGGTGKKIIWSVFEDTQGLTGNYQAVVKISKIIEKKHSGFVNMNLPTVSLIGVKYAYLNKFGGYVSCNILYDDDDPLVIGGPLIRATKSIYPYAGFGINVFAPEDILIEAGSIINPRKCM